MQILLFFKFCKYLHCFVSALNMMLTANFFFITICKSALYQRGKRLMENVMFATV